MAWIKTSDSLPPFQTPIYAEEESDFVLTYDKHGYRRILQLVAVGDILMWFEDDNGLEAPRRWSLDDIVAWMPLP